MRRYLTAVITFLIIFYLSSCSQGNSLISSSVMENAVNLELSASPGKIINPNFEDSISIHFSYDEATVLPEKMEIALLDGDKAVIGEPEIIEGGELNEEIPSVDTTSLEDGLYYLRVRVYDSDGQLLRETLTPFFNSRIPVQIKGIDVFPPEFTPGSSGLVFPDVDVPDNMRDTVWIRWVLGDSIFSEGSLESYKNGLVWNSPGSEGVFTLTMEVFPQKPPEGVPSSLHTSTQLFVTSNIASNRYDLGPGSSYTVLLNLNGSTSNEGVTNLDGTVWGSYFPGVKEGGFGYFLSEGAGVNVPVTGLPFAEDGMLAPFSLILRLSISDPQISRQFISLGNASGEIVVLGTDESGIMELELRQGKTSIKDTMGKSPLDFNELTLSVIPHGDEITFLWYADGLLVHSASMSWIPLKSSGLQDGGFTLLGGDKGFNGFVDYFGIYYRDGEGRADVDPFVFTRSLERNGKIDSLFFYEGFDGLYPPSSVEVMNPGVSVSVEEGNLVVSPGSKIFLFRETNFSLGMTINADVREGFGSGKFLVRIVRDGSVTGEDIAVDFKGDAPHASFVYNDSGLSLKEGDVLYFGIYNAGGSDILKVASITGAGGKSKVVESKASAGSNKL